MADARKKAEKAKKEKEQKEEFKYSDSDSEFEYCPSPSKRKTSAISEATSKWIIEGVEHELIYSEASSDEEIVETMATIFDYFDEHIIQEDGNWLFRALSFATFGDDEYHITIRETIWDYIQKNLVRFKEFIEGDENDYIQQMRNSSTWGGNIEIVAFSEIFDVSINIFDQITVFDPHYQVKWASTEDKINIIFRNNNHYNVLIKKDTEWKFEEFKMPKMKSLENKKESKLIKTKRNTDFIEKKCISW